MQALLDFGSPAVTWLLLAAVGLELRPEDFGRVRERPRLVAVGVLTPLLLLPPLAALLIAALHPPPFVAGGLLILAACPQGGISSTYSQLARASTALAVTLTAVSCAAAVVTIPLAGLALEHVFDRPLPFAAPLLVLLRNLVSLAIPIGLGMLARARFPGPAERLRPFVQRIGFLLLAILLALLFSGDLGELRAGLLPAFVMGSAFTMAAFVLGGLVAVACRTSRADRFTLAAEFATRNAAVATALALALADDPGYLLFISIYLVCEIPLLVLAAAVVRRGSAGAEPA